MRLNDLFNRTLFIGLGIAVGVFIAIRFVFSPIIDPLVRMWITLAGIPLGALAGGFYAGRQFGRMAWIQAALVAVLEMLVLLLFSMMPLDPLVAAVTLAAGLLGAFLAQRMPYSAQGTPFTSGRGYTTYPPGRTVFPPTSTGMPRFRMPRITNPFAGLFSGMRANQSYQQLLRRVRMDRDLADRLIEFERRRTPRASREALIRSAIERLSRDNR